MIYEKAHKKIHLLGVSKLSDLALYKKLPFVRSCDTRILTKIVTGVDDCWNEELNETQIKIIENLKTEVEKWT